MEEREEVSGSDRKRDIIIKLVPNQPITVKK